MTSIRAPVFRSVALKPRTTARVSPAVFQRRSLVVRAEVRCTADVLHHAKDIQDNNVSYWSQCAATGDSLLFCCGVVGGMCMIEVIVWINCIVTTDALLFLVLTTSPYATT